MEKISLKDGARIVFFGDSITEGGLFHKNYVQLVREDLARRFPKTSISIVNAGISGDTVLDLNARLERDVLAKQPTLVFVYIGINDVWQDTFGQGTPPEIYDKTLREIAIRLRSQSADVALCTVSVIGEKVSGANPLDGRLDQFAEIARKAAFDLKLPLCDLRKAFFEYLRLNNPANKEAGILTSDGVHLTRDGDSLVAQKILELIE